MMKTSQKSNYLDMYEAIIMMGFEQLESNFFRRVETISKDAPNDSQLIIYCELFEDSITVNVYEDAKFIQESRFSEPLEFIDAIQSILDTYNIADVKLVPIESDIKINGIMISAADNRLSTKDMLKKMIRVKSSNLWSYAFQPKDYNTGTMLIQFKGPNGGPNDVYVYYDIPNKLWQKFVAAPSKGHFFWQNIRNIFKYGKLTGDKRTKLKNGV